MTELNSGGLDAYFAARYGLDGLQHRMAVRVIAGQARDAEDLRLLCAALGLDPKEGR